MDANRKGIVFIRVVRFICIIIVTVNLMQIVLKALNIQSDMEQAITEIENIQETEDNDMDIEDEVDTVETAVMEEQEQDNKIEVKTANGDKYVVSTEQEPVTTSATVAETKTENSSATHSPMMNLLRIVPFLVIVGIVALFFFMKIHFFDISSDINLYIIRYISEKKLPRRFLKYLFRFSNRDENDDEEQDAQHYIVMDKPYELNRSNKQEEFIYEVLTEFYRMLNKRNFWRVLDDLLGFATYLYGEIPGCVKEKNVSKVQQKFMQVLEYMINDKLEKLNPEWLESEKENLRDAILNCTLPLKVKGNEVRVSLRDYKPIEQEVEGILKEKSNKVDYNQISTGIVSVVETIDKALPYVENKEVEKQMKESKKLLNIIFTMLKQTTAPDDKMKRLLNYYFPTYVKLLNTYCELKDQYVNTEVENVDVLTREVEETVGTMNHMMLSYLNNKVEKQVWDVQSDISVIKTMLKQDGYTN